MADRVLFISWDEPVRGREERSLEVFNDCVGYYGRLQQTGHIEKFDATFLTPTGTGIGGYFTLHGTTEQISAVQNDEEFQRLMTDATLVVDQLRVIPGYTNEGIAAQMEIYVEAIAKLPALAR